MDMGQPASMEVINEATDESAPSPEVAVEKIATATVESPDAAAPAAAAK